MFQEKFQLIWQGVTYEPISFEEIIVGQWEIDGVDEKGEQYSTTRKDYIYFSEEEEDWGEWKRVNPLPQ